MGLHGARRVPRGRAGSPLGDQGDEGGGGQGLDSEEEPASSESAPSEAAALSHTSPPRVGFGCEGCWKCPGRRNSFHLPVGCRNGFRSSVRELGWDAGTGKDWWLTAPSWVTAEKQPGEGLVESGAGLGLEMLQKWHYGSFQRNINLGWGVCWEKEGWEGRGRWVHRIMPKACWWGRGLIRAWWEVSVVASDMFLNPLAPSDLDEDLEREASQLLVLTKS